MKGSKSTVRLTEYDIVQLLAGRHIRDIFVAGCKDGPTQYTSGLRVLDGWAMTRSWMNMRWFGYEVKVSRSDFLRDEKWQSYLPLCNHFSFVCPYGMIQPEELPAEVGLLWVNKVGTGLWTKRKAAYRKIEPPVDLLFYILMCRSRIVGSVEGFDKEAYWREWLAKKEENREMGHSVSRGVRQRYLKMEQEVEGTRRLLKHAEGVIEFVKKYHVDVDRWHWEEELTNRLLAKHGTVPSTVIDELELLQKGIERTIRGLRGKVKEEQKEVAGA